MCGKGSTQSTTTVNRPPQEVIDNYNYLTPIAKQTAATPFTPYTGQLTADFNNTLQNGVAGASTYANAAQPYINAGMGIAAANLGSIGPEQFSSEALQKYMSPYMSNVVDSTMANLDRSNIIAQQMLKSGQARSGAFGGDRRGVAAANLSREQGLATGKTLGDLLQSGYGQAVGEFNNQQGVNLGAQQADAARNMQIAQLISNLGVSGQQAGLQGSQAEMQAGAVQRQAEQEGLSAQYGQYAQQQAYPFQTTGWLANILTGMGSQMGGTSTQTSPAPNQANAIIGGGLGLASLFNLATGGRIPQFAAGGGMAIGEIPYAGAQDFFSYVPKATLQARPISFPRAPELPKQAPIDYKGAASGIGAIGKGLGNWFGSKPSGQWDNMDEVSQSGRGDDWMPYASGGSVEDPNDFNMGPMPLFMSGDSENLPTFAKGDVFANDVPLPKSDTPVFAQGKAFAKNIPTTPGMEMARRVRSEPFKMPSSPELNFDESEFIERPPEGVAVAGPRNGWTAARPTDLDNIDDVWARTKRQESGNRHFDARGNVITSSAGAVGIAQVMPGTGPEAARLAGLEWDPQRLQSDPQYNETLGKAYLNEQIRKFGSVPLGLAAYNGGPGRLAQAIERSRREGGSPLDYMPTETKQYVASIMGGARAYSPGSAPAPGMRAQPTSEAPSMLQGIGRMLGMTGGDSPKPEGKESSGPFGNPFGLTPEGRMGLLAAGLGIMASPAPRVGQAIGQGGLAGIHAYGEAKKMDMEQTKQMATLTAGLRSLNAGRQIAGLPELTMAEYLGKPSPPRVAGSSGLPTPPYTPSRSTSVGSDAPASVGPRVGVSAPEGAPGVPNAPAAARPASPPLDKHFADAGYKTADDVWRDAAPEYNPQYFAGKVQQAETNARIMEAYGNAAAGKSWMEYASHLRQRMNDLLGKPILMQSGPLKGQSVPPPGSLVSEERKLRMEKGVAADNEFVDTQPVAGGPTVAVRKSDALRNASPTVDAPAPTDGAPASPGTAGNPPGVGGIVTKQPPAVNTRQEGLAKREIEMASQFESRQTSADRLDKIAKILEVYHTGKWADHKADIIAMARSAGLNMKDTDTASPANFEKFIKNSTGAVFEAVKNMGGRPLVAEIEGLQRAYMNPNMQPESNRDIVGQAIGLLKYEDAKYEAFRKWKKDNPYAVDDGDFLIDFAKKNPVDKFIKEAKKNIAPLGIPLPKDPAELDDGQVYSVRHPKTNKILRVRWNAETKKFEESGKAGQ